MSERRQIETTCAYCGVGCGVRATVAEDRIIAVEGSQAHPANHGRLCVKGAALHETMGEQGRLLQPRVDGEAVGWDFALDQVAERLNRVRRRYGPGSVAFYLSGQLLTEDYYVANKLAKGFIGTGHVDTNSRLCMSSAVAAHKRAFGEDLVPGNYEDLELSDLLVLVGSNAAWTHPVLYQRMAAAKQKNPRLKVVVLDPRRTATADLADLHLPIAPGSDAHVFAGLLHWLEATDALDHAYIVAHTSGFSEALRAASPWTIQRVAAVTGLDQAQLLKFYGWFAQTRKTVTFFSQGVNQSASGSDKGNAIINCHLATGRIGQPGMGPFSITGQPNAMGGREVGGLANTLAAHMDYSPRNRALVAEFWGSEQVSKGPGYKAVDLFAAVERKEIRAIWIMGTNPVVSMPDADRVRRALERCETVIVSDCIADTDTTATADILLPALGWGEKDGTVTNSERRISRQRALVAAPGAAKADWWILAQVAQRMGFAKAFAYAGPHEIFAEHAALSGHANQGARVFDISGLAGLDQQAYDALQPVQWPVTSQQPYGTARLFGNGQFATADGRAQFVPVVAQGAAQSAGRDYPLLLNTGRVRDQWHTMTRTGRSARLLQHTDAPFAQLHPDTASQLAVQPGDLLEIATRLGSIRVLASIDAGIAPDQVFVPIHWNDRFASQARVDALVAPITDPVSGQPEFKCTPAQVSRIEVGSWAVIATRTELDCSEFAFWARIPVAAGEVQVYRVAVPQQFDWDAFLRRSAASAESSFTRQSKAVPGDYRYCAFADGLASFAVFGTRAAARLPQTDWLQTLMLQESEDALWRWFGGSEQACDGRRVCSCFQVGEQRIVEAIIAGADSVEALGKQLKCGTNCGSCIPELKALIEQKCQAGAA